MIKKYLIRKNSIEVSKGGGGSKGSHIYKRIGVGTATPLIVLIFRGQNKSN